MMADVHDVRQAVLTCVGDNMSNTFESVLFRIGRKLEEEQRMTGLSVSEIKRRLVEEWEYTGDDNDVRTNN